MNFGAPFCAQRLTDPDSVVQINFITVRGKRRLVASWEAMKATIMSALDSKSRDLEDLMSFRDCTVALEKGINARGKDGNPIFSTFRSLLQGNQVFRHFVVHRETVVASFAKFGAEFISYVPEPQRESLKQLSEVTFVPPTFVDLPLTY